ncbi:MAG: hypothetical protein K5787_14800 [Lentisphaeria bacterium]|nr:hypothetical protein [Lentisphaeria bacterium]
MWRLRLAVALYGVPPAAWDVPPGVPPAAWDVPRCVPPAVSDVPQCVPPAAYAPYTL